MQNEQTPAAGLSLLPCPFCGSPPLVEDWHCGGPEPTMISCSLREYGDEHDGCSVGPLHAAETYAQAAAAWNRRAPASSSSVVQGDASGVERAHGPKCWGTTSFSDEVAHCYCGPSEDRPQPSGETRGLGWLDVKDAPQDGSEILLNHRTHGIIQGWFSKGEWSDDTPNGPREYSGDMWILGDDLFQDEVEYGENQEVIPSGVTGWLPLDALIRPAPVASSDQPGQGGVFPIAGHVVWWKEGGVSFIPAGEEVSIDRSCRVEPLTPAEPAEARVRELETERDTWKALAENGARQLPVYVAQLAKAREALEEARTELGAYEQERSGETYNNPKLNQVLAALQQAGEVG